MRLCTRDAYRNMVRVTDLRSAIIALAEQCATKVVSAALEHHITELAFPTTTSTIGSLDAVAGAVVALFPRKGRYRELELAVLRRALAQTGGNKSAAAQLLGLPRKVFTRRLARLERAQPPSAR
jgi:DNA-binding NtrC family response regulator